MPLALFLAYPVLVHLGVLLGLLWLQALALVCLAAGLFYRPLRAGSLSAWAGFISASIFIAWLMQYKNGMHALYVPPVALTALAFWAFASSLRPGQMPMITRIAQAVDGPLRPELVLHTRRITLLWALLLGAMLIVTLALTFAGPRAWWSWFTNFFSYVLMGSALGLDYLYRRWRFPDHDRDGFIAHIRRVIRGSAAARP